MKIPKKIHLTCKDKNNIQNQIWINCLNKYYEMYNDYEIIIYDNSDIYNIIEKFFPQYLDKIKQITIGAILADIFRYLIIYLEGGIYSDLDCEPIKHIDTLLDKNYKFFHGDEERNDNFYIYINGKIANKQWDFYHNVCDNSKIVKNTSNPIVMKCLGHSIGDVSTILCYECDDDWVHKEVIENKHLCYKGVSVCQWLLISEPKQDVFLKMFMHCMENIDKLINIERCKNYHYTILNTCGPGGFTKIVMDNLSDKIKILPSDFFCAGSWGQVPFTKNSYFKHHFTGSWR